jgi:hypothetical protein
MFKMLLRFKHFFAVVLCLFVGDASAQLSVTYADCGVTAIGEVLSGPRHGAMVRVENTACGTGGWVCLDSNSVHLTPATSKRVFDLITLQYALGKPIYLTHYIGKSECGGYPVIEDVRTR